MMKFDELDKKMRIYETAHDLCVLPGIYMVARLDGRGFTRLTKEILELEVPFDVKFRDMMLETTQHLMQCGFKIIYGYTESDEISLLFDIADNTFSRKLRKLNSVLAGEASARFTLLSGVLACFDSRISQLPARQLVVDYFRWRNEDAGRNALNSHCYWILRKNNFSKREATSKLKGLSNAEKNEMLFQYGINFNDLPAWQKRGVGIYWQEYEKEGFDPIQSKKKKALRRKLEVETELPMRANYEKFILKIIEAGATPK
jgi:tRNA(His) 5'-end guanylyltransferase